MLAGFADRTLFNSTDGGETFFKGVDLVYEEAGIVLSMTEDPDDVNVVYVSRRDSTVAGTGVFRSPGIGDNFTQIGSSATGLTGQPVELLQAVVEIGSGEYFHAKRGRMLFSPDCIPLSSAKIEIHTFK